MASATSPATWPVSIGCPNPVAEDSAIGSAFRLPLCGWIPGEGLGVADGLIEGNRPDALPGAMSELETPLRVGMGPSGKVVWGTAPDGDWLVGDPAAEAGAAVTATVSVADGGVHFTEVTTLAVAVSFTDVTEVALDATGICA